MSNRSYNTLAEKKSVQIIILIFAICSAVWFAFFAHNYKEIWRRLLFWALQNR